MLRFDSVAVLIYFNIYLIWYKRNYFRISCFLTRVSAMYLVRSSINKYRLHDACVSILSLFTRPRFRCIAASSDIFLTDSTMYGPLLSTSQTIAGFISMTSTSMPIQLARLQIRGEKRRWVIVDKVLIKPVGLACLTFSIMCWLLLINYNWFEILVNYLYHLVYFYLSILLPFLS